MPGPITPGSGFAEGVCQSTSLRDHAVWVPAFAGTTRRGSLQRLVVIAVAGALLRGDVGVLEIVVRIVRRHWGQRLLPLFPFLLRRVPRFCHFAHVSLPRPPPS